MSTRREFVKQTAASAIAAATPAAITEAREVASTATKAPTRASKAGLRSGAHIKSVIRRDETVLRYGDGDNWHMSWASDNRQYVSLCDGTGFTDQPKAGYSSRMFAVSGGPRDATFHDLPGYPMIGTLTLAPKDPRYYGFGTLALDGHLYQFLSSSNRRMSLDELKDPSGITGANVMRFNGVKLIYSPDQGRTWHNQDGSTPVRWESWERRSRETMVFFEENQEAFSLLTVLQMGKNYEQNRDGYLYVYAPNGNTEGTMNELVMFRVPKAQLLNRGAYEYFSGLKSGGAAKWSKDIGARKPVHTFPRGWVNKLWHPYAWHPSVVYNAPLGVYMMANWGNGSATGVDAWSGVQGREMWFSKPSYLGFWIARDPWGPWTQIHEEAKWLPGGDENARAYQPQIAPKWISPDGKSFWLAWTDFQVTDREASKRALEEYMRNANNYGEANVIRDFKMRRKFQPYYAFNVQRVDLDVA